MADNQVMFSNSLAIALSNGVVKDYDTFQKFYEIDFKVSP